MSSSSAGASSASQSPSRSRSASLAFACCCSKKKLAWASTKAGHNSGVIHSGIYYKPGSLKARLCVEGAHAMVEFCRAHGIPHQVCGKVIVATREDEFPRLEELQRRGAANGLTGLQIARPRTVAGDRTACQRPARALLVPSTGITRLRRRLRKVCRNWSPRKVGLSSLQPR